MRKNKRKCLKNLKKKKLLTLYKPKKKKFFCSHLSLSFIFLQKNPNCFISVLEKLIQTFFFSFVLSHISSNYLLFWFSVIVPLLCYIIRDDTSKPYFNISPEVIRFPSIVILVVIRCFQINFHLIPSSLLHF